MGERLQRSSHPAQSATAAARARVTTATLPLENANASRLADDLIIPTGRRTGQSPSVPSIYRALATRRLRPYPDAVELAQAEHD